MGCVTSNNKRVTMPATRVVPVRQYAQADKTGTFRVRILEAIKRKDPILFEKTLQRFQVKTNELVTTTEANKRSILHDIAEANFTEGMSLILDYLIQKEPNKMSFILNTTDSQGNTPMMTCCLWNAPDTLDILLRYDLIDLNGKNLEGKTAVELAIENSTACVTILNTISAGGAKSMTRYTHSSAAEIAITPRHHTSILLKSNKKDFKLPPINKDNSAGSRDLSTPLTSVLSLTRESPSRVGPTSKLFNLINDLKDKDTNFIDEEFPHTIFSLMGEDSDENIPGLKWVRPTEFLNMDLKKIKLFEGIDLNDVSRSDLAGCDLYSALAAMTEFPQRLLNAFTIKEVNKYGAYSVKFLIAGIPVEIMLDDYFPCYENGQLVYSSPLGNEIWFLLIEKSFAKLYGSYSEIRRVYISEALELITGMPSSQHSVKEMEEEELWNNMYDYDKKNYIFCAGVYADEDDKNKIFTIINLYEDKQYKIIKLRNPFRDFEWDGLFSEKSKLWTKELKEEIGFAKGEKSAIYMEIKEFIEHFDFLSVCHYQDGWFRNRVDVVSDPSTAVFCEIVLEEETEVFISVHQRLPLYVTNSPDYDISPVEIMLAEKNDSNSFTKIACGENDAYLGKQTTYVDQKVKIRLPEGKYVMRVKIRWVDGNEHDFTVNTFSQKNLTLKQGREEDYPNFLEKVYLDAGRRMKERYLYSNSCELYSEWSGSHLWIYGVNNGKKTWNLEVLFQQFENIRLPKKYSKDENTLQMIVLPGKQKVVYAKRIDDGKVEIQWNLKNKWE